MGQIEDYLKKHPHVSMKCELKAPDTKRPPIEYPAGYIPLEEEEQREVCRWLDEEYPGIKYFSVPNGGKRSAREGAAFKKTGVKAGVPDLCFPIARGCCHGFYLEMKRIKGSRVEEDQAIWLDFLRGQGYATYVALGAEKAKEMILKYWEYGPFDPVEYQLMRMRGNK